MGKREDPKLRHSSSYKPWDSRVRSFSGRRSNFLESHYAFLLLPTPLLPNKWTVLEKFVVAAAELAWSFSRALLPVQAPVGLLVCILLRRTKIKNSVKRGNLLPDNIPKLREMLQQQTPWQEFHAEPQHQEDTIIFSVLFWSDAKMSASRGLKGPITAKLFDK